ncbi:tyrosine-type recombinase/integrase [Plastorhodobacter daqingensis]|uniref:Tyrosine-type recombinase/integrase n=1 Tax=Plastorhodobacter daqingensis TaxID=1387281 RepID=A0ABW2UGG4_9RHOB
MPLSDVACRNAKPADKPRKMSDGDGLYLQVQPSGSKLWRMNYRFEGKQKTLAFGSYPAVDLGEARRRRDRARKVLALGRDPSKEDHEQPGVVTFEAVMNEWFESQSENWVPAYAQRVLGRLKVNVLPEIGKRAVDTLEPADILKVLREVEKRGVLYSAGRIKQYISLIMRYAVSTGRAPRDPTADLRGALRPPPKPKHMHKLPADEIGSFVLNLRNYAGEEITALSIEFILHTFVRTNELRFAKWAEFKDTVWRIPAARMKMRRDHLVPLTPRVQEILARLKVLSADSELVAPGNGGKPMSTNTMIYALYNMGYRNKVTIHGLRGTASTFLNESGLWLPDAIERQLAHVPGDTVRAAYNAALYWDERCRMMQWWSDHIVRETDVAELTG